MVELLGWEANALDTTEDVPIEEWEDTAGPPLYVEGWRTVVRDGLMHIAYYILVDTPDGQRRRIIDRHVMHQKAIKESRPGTNRAIAAALRCLNG